MALSSLYKNFYPLIILMIFSHICEASETESNQEIEYSLRAFLNSIDEKNVSKIADHFYFDRRGWDRGPVFCFGESTTREFVDIEDLKKFFNNWAKSNRNAKSTTQINELYIALLFDGKENKLYNADATFNV